MKRVIGLFSFMLFLGTVSMNAQENVNPETAVSTEVKQSCSKSKTACSASCAAKASKAADMADNIEKSVCPVSGKVSYKRKDVCEKSGKVSLTDVRYDEASATFVSLENDTDAEAAVETTAKKKGCSKKCSKTCGKKAAMKSAESDKEATSEATSGAL